MAKTLAQLTDEELLFLKARLEEKLAQAKEWYYRSYALAFAYMPDVKRYASRLTMIKVEMDKRGLQAEWEVYKPLKDLTNEELLTLKAGLKEYIAWLKSPDNANDEIVFTWREHVRDAESLIRVIDRMLARTS